MTTYYTDYKNGSDLIGNGSSATPWKTLTKAFASCANGDTIKLRGGDVAGERYRECPSTSKTGLTIEADTGHTPVMVGSTEYTSWILTVGQLYTYETAYVPTAAWAVWNGVTRLTSVASVAACEALADSYYFDNAGDKLYVHIAGGGAPTSIEAVTANAYALSNTGAGATVRNLIFQWQVQAVRNTAGACHYDSLTIRYWYPAFSSDAFSPIHLTAATNLVENCHITSERGRAYGISVAATASTVEVCNNTIVGTDTGIYIAGGVGHSIHSNEISGWDEDAINGVGNSTGVIYGNACASYGVTHGGIRTGATGGTSDWMTYQNTVYEVTAGLVYGLITDGGNADFYHNTLVGPATGIIVQSNNEINAENNIAINTNYGYHVVTGYTPTGTRDYNCAYNYATSAYREDWAAGAHDVLADPLFTDVGSYDFTLTAFSPCRDTGISIPGINDGYYGLAPDIGRWEYVIQSANRSRYGIIGGSVICS